MSYASVVEPFRAANRLSGRDLYEWTNLSMGGGYISASAETAILTERVQELTNAPDIVFVFAAGDPAEFRDRDCFAWLRAMARSGTTIAGVSGGPYLLARAGLLEGYRATIHWEHAESLLEEYPDLRLEAGLFVIDRDRVTCAGGTAGLDLAIDLIGRDHGEALARQVADWFIRTDDRQPGQSQRATIENRYGTTNDRLVRMLAAMERSMEEPLSCAALAGEAGVSIRQLERLCRQEFGATVAQTGLSIRLNHAARLLRSTGMQVADVAVACGFVSLSHFSRTYRNKFGHSPGKSRLVAPR